MKKKISVCLISVFLFMFSVPRICFAQLGVLLSADNAPEISCAVSKAVNVLDISSKIVRVYYEGAKDFFFNMCLQRYGGCETPVYGRYADNIFLGIPAQAVCGGKKDMFCGKIFAVFSGFFDERMRGSPARDCEPIRLYLLFIEALHKGSVPAFGFIDGKKYYFRVRLVLKTGRISFSGKTYE